MIDSIKDSRMLNNLSSGMVGGERISQSKELNLTALKHCLQCEATQLVNIIIMLSTIINVIIIITIIIIIINGDIQCELLH